MTGNVWMGKLVGNVWIEVAMLPFVLVLVLFLASRMATRSELNRHFFFLACSTLAAATLDVALWLLLARGNLSPGALLLLKTLRCAVMNVNAWYLMRYVTAYVAQGAPHRHILDHAILWGSLALLAYNLAAPFLGLPSGSALLGPLYKVLSSGPALFFIVEAFCLQIIYQRYYGNGQFIIMNLLFLLLIDAFLIQYVFKIDFPVIYVVGSILLFILFFYLQAPMYRQIVTAQEDTEAARAWAEASILQANAANRARSDFLASTSHEIRTPMNAILGMNEMILKESGDQETREASLNIRRAGNQLLALINNILDISKIESGKMELFTSDYHLCQLIKDWEDHVHEDLREAAHEEGVRFVLDVDPFTPEHLHGDELRLRQIVVNLLDNAVKYTDQGAVTLSVLGRKEEGAAVRLTISVKDTGMGIREEDLPRLFRHFERVNIVETRSIPGAGLGLSLVKHLLLLMNGDVRVESTYGRGSTFTIELLQELAGDDETTVHEYEDKLARGEAALDTPEEAEAGDEPFICPEARLLIVDDTPVNLVVAKGMLKSSEAQIDTAESGEAALEMMGREHYDIVFLDHKMPGMDGVETLFEAKRLFPSVMGARPTFYVALTANAGARSEYIELGFDDYLAKPFKSDVMMGILKRYLSGTV